MRSLLTFLAVLTLFVSTSTAQIITSTNKIKIVGEDGSLTLDYTGTGDSILTLNGPSLTGGDADNALALGGIAAEQWVKYKSFSGTGSQTVASMPVTPGVYEVDITIFNNYFGTGWNFSVSSGTVSFVGVLRTSTGAASEFTGSVGVTSHPSTMKAYVTCTGTGTLNLDHSTGPGYGFRGHVTFRRMQL